MWPWAGEGLGTPFPGEKGGSWLERNDSEANRRALGRRLLLGAGAASCGSSAPGHEPSPARAAAASRARPRPSWAPPPGAPPASWREQLPEAIPLPLRVRAGSQAPGRHRHLGRCRRHRLHPSSPSMAEELSAATSYTEDDFYCPVCQEVLKTPVRTAACQHVFCRKCFLTAMRESGIHCPLCRGNVTRRERACPERALDLENIMRKFSGSCRCCAKQIKFYRMRHHYKSCKKYQDEYGVSSIIPNFQISQDSVGNSNRSETSASDNIETYQENTGSSGHPTFKCPLCQESNFTRQRLLDHCNSNHLFQIVPVVSMCVYDSLLFKECCSIYFPSCVQGTVVNLNLDGTLSVRYILSSKD